MIRPAAAALIAFALVACAAGSPGAHATVPRSPRHSSVAASSIQSPGRPGRPPAHVVVVVEENHAYGEIIGNPNAPYMNRLARSGRLLTRMHAITHPSEPNYLALFSGSTHGITDDSCPHSFAGPNLGAQLIAHHRTFVGYAQGLPRAGSKVCTSGAYARKHAPWVNFSDLPAKRTNRPFSSFPSTYSNLPTVSFVVPNLDNDMHDGTIAQADTWLRRHLGGYARWAGSHHSLLIVTWDENDGSPGNHIPAIVVGAGVRSGRYAHRATLYSLLRLIEAEYGLRLLGGAATAPPISLR